MTAMGPAMPKHTTPGKRYFVVDCLACGKPIPMAEAPPPNQRPDPLPYRVVSDLRCPYCGYVGSYEPLQMSPTGPMRRCSQRAAW
jgi:hypothetical protein